MKTWTFKLGLALTFIVSSSWAEDPAPVGSDPVQNAYHEAYRRMALPGANATQIMNETLRPALQKRKEENALLLQKKTREKELKLFENISKDPKENAKSKSENASLTPAPKPEETPIVDPSSVPLELQFQKAPSGKQDTVKKDTDVSTLAGTGVNEVEFKRKPAKSAPKGK